MIPPRVLLVDDEAKILTALCRALQPDGYTLYTASGPRQALELLSLVPMDVLISDNLMPGMNGLELLTQARRKWPDVMRVMLTGLDDVGVALRAVEQGAVFRYHTKPWNPVELRVTVRLAVQHRASRLETRHLLDFLDRSHAGQLEALAALAPAGLLTHKG